MAGVGIIANPHSKLNKRDPERTKLLSYIAGSRGTIKVTQTLSELDDVANQFLDKNIEVLAINGGDGTISQTLSAFARIYKDKPLPKIAVLKGGTINMLAQNLALSGSPQEILAKTLESYSLGTYKTETLQTLNIDGKIGFLFASGTSSRFLEKFYENKSNALGSVLLAVKLAFSILLGLSFYKKIVISEPLNLTLDKQKKGLNLSLSVLVSTVKNMPIGVPYFFDPSPIKDGFYVSSINLKVKDLATRLLFLITNRTKNKSYEYRSMCKEMSIESKNPITYTLDGEIYLAKNSKIEVKKGPKLSFIIPHDK